MFLGLTCAGMYTHASILQCTLTFIVFHIELVCMIVDPIPRHSLKFYDSNSMQTCLPSLHDRAICGRIQASFFFPRLKQLQIAAKLFSPGNTESSTAQEGERLSRSNENPR